MAPKPRSLAERFWPKVHKGPTCWIWNAYTDKLGYGYIGAGGWHGGKLCAHRVAWELTRGPIPDGLWVLHKCNNPPCVNPDHLYLGTQADNMRDAADAGVMGSKRLDWWDVRLIRLAHAAGVSCKFIGMVFGIHKHHVTSIAKRRAWSVRPPGEYAPDVLDVRPKPANLCRRCGSRLSAENSYVSAGRICKPCRNLRYRELYRANHYAPPPGLEARLGELGL